MTTLHPNFTEFRTFGSRVNSNFIAITTNGTISLYSGFTRKNNISSFPFCIILYDKEQKLLGLQFGGDELGEGAYRINHEPNGHTAYIIAKNFFIINDELSLTDLKGKYVPEKFEDAERKNVFILDLNKKIKSK